MPVAFHLKNMKLELVKYMCNKCCTQFKAPEIPSETYGDFLLRSETPGETRYLAALTDCTYDEVDAIASADAAVASQTAHQRAKILRAIYGQVACDPDSNGRFFNIGLHPVCPSCGGQISSSWEFMEPPEFVNVNIPPVTHTAWNEMSSVAKKSAVFENLSRLQRDSTKC